MDRDFVEIPRRRRLTALNAWSITLIFICAERVSGDARALRLKPGRRLMADCSLKQLPLGDRTLVRPLCRNRRALGLE